MKITKLFLGLLFLSSIGYGQTFKSKLTHLGNDFTVKVEEDQKHQFEVFITNDSNDGASKKILIKGGVTESFFVKSITDQFNTLSSNYIFNSETIDSLNIKVASIVSYKAALSNDVYHELLGNMKPNKKTLEKAFSAKIKYKDFNSFVNVLDNSVVNIDSLVITKNTVNDKPVYKITFKGKDIIEKKFTNENELFEKFDSLRIVRPIILSSFYGKSDIQKVLNTDLIAVNRKKLATLYRDAISKDTYKFVGSYIVDSSLNAYEVSVKRNMKENYFVLRFCNDTLPDCSYSFKQVLNISHEKFQLEVNRIVKSMVKTDTLAAADITFLYTNIILKNEKAVIVKAQAPIQKELDSLLYQIENAKTEYSGVLKLNESVEIYTFKKNIIGFKKMKNTPISQKFKPKYATIRFFNNRAQNIVVVGDVIDANDEIVSEEVSVNFSWGIPIRSFNSRLNFISIVDKDGNDLGLMNYNDLFSYYPYKEKFNYAVKNTEYRVEAGKTIKVEQRRLADYFTPIIFSDFLGLNNSSENGLIIAEAKARIPLWIFNLRRVTLFPSIRADVNVSLYNGFDDSSRTITREGTGDFDAMLDSNEISAFDYVKFANVNANLSLDLANFEMKGLSTDASFGVGIRYYRAAFKYTNTDAAGKDDVLSDQLNALAPEVNLNFQIRPQTNFGADLNVAYSWLNARGAKNNTEVSVPNSYKDKAMLRLNLDLYSKVSPDKTNGGIYGRIGGYYHLETKDFYPQIMIGYATNLSSFVNKFKKEDTK